MTNYYNDRFQLTVFVFREVICMQKLQLLHTVFDKRIDSRVQQRNELAGQVTQILNIRLDGLWNKVFVTSRLIGWPTK